MQTRQKRALILSQSPDELMSVVEQSQPEAWSFVVSDSYTGTSLRLQHSYFNVLILDETDYQYEGLEGLSWLARNHDVPILFLADVSPTAITQAFTYGASNWLPRKQSLQFPSMLLAALDCLVSYSNVRNNNLYLEKQLHETRSQLDQLVDVLWRTGPLDADRGWYTYRHMLQRLQEEISHSQRFRMPLTIALGEIKSDETEKANEVDLSDWVSTTISKIKRKSDIAGQYDLPTRFLLLMRNTPSKGAVQCCNRLRRHLESGEAKGKKLQNKFVTKFGVASCSTVVHSPEKLLSEAEANLLKC